jgi:hypothetical protein
MDTIVLSNGNNVLKSDYITIKTKELVEFGYTNLTEEEVSIQVEKILKKESEGRLSCFSLFIIDDIVVD